MNRRSRIVALCAAIAVTMGVGISAAAAQPASDEAPEATEVGVTAKEIRIAVIADVDTSLAPGLFQGSVDAVEGFAKFINATGGLAGRKLVVDFIDSRLSADDARNAVIKACSEDLAMVGTAALFLNNVDDQLACVDKAGDETGIPDIPFVTTEVVQQCSPITFPVSPPTLDCATKDDHPQTYHASVGRGLYYKKRFGSNLHGIYIFPADLRSAYRATFSSGLGQIRQVCCKSDRDFELSERATRAAFTPVAQELKSSNGTYAQSTGPFNSTVSLRKEAKLQGVNSVKVWDCGPGCYDPRLIEEGGAEVEDQFADTQYLPFLNGADRKANKMLAAFYKYTGADSAGALGAPYSWIAAVAFRDAVDAAVEENGVNGLTRAALLEALNGIHKFDADGMYSQVDLAGRKVGPCHVLNQVKNGKFVRVIPKKPGTFDCPKGGVVTAKLDLLNG